MERHWFVSDNGFSVRQKTGGDSVAIADCIFGNEIERRHNAKFIAAAPKMLAALRCAADALTPANNSEEREALAMINAAIDSATGEPFRCKGCGRPEDDCSADPCPDVIEDRGEL